MLTFQYCFQEIRVERSGSLAEHRRQDHLSFFFGGTLRRAEFD
jgi:hypothetical protein